MNKKRALITGISGQDGAYLTKLLISKNYNVIGTSRNPYNVNLWRLKYLGIKKKIKIFDNSILGSPKFFISKKLDEIYNLSASSSVSKSFKYPIKTFKSNTLDSLQILNSIYLSKRKIKYYQASSSEMFGNIKNKCNDRTKFNPLSPYAISKLSAHQLTLNYRSNYGLFACNGILFNHESPLRDENYVSKKIIKNLLKYKNNKNHSFELGNIYSKRDWGHAEDYVRAMYLIMQFKSADDFLITSGFNYSIKNFIDIVCNRLSLKAIWKGRGLSEVLVDSVNNKIIIKINKKLFRPLDIKNSSGNSSKAKKYLKWECKKSFTNLIDEMISFERKN
tara:strand:+ start:275 stop:1276 length:1002 start_codon:yes stop_codon:yes gene_type:complete